MFGTIERAEEKLVILPREDPANLLIWIDGFIAGREQIGAEEMKHLKAKIKKYMTPTWVVAGNSNE